MASPVVIQAQPGKTGITIDMYPVDSVTPIVTNFALSEKVANSGVYEGNYLGADVGLHQVIIKQGLRTLGNWYIDLKNSGIIDKAGDLNPDIDDIKPNSFVGGTDSLPAISARLTDSLNHLKALVYNVRGQIDQVNSQTEFISTIIAPVENDSIIGSHSILYFQDDISEMNIRKITGYDGIGRFTLESAPSFTLTTADTFSIVLDKKKVNLEDNQLVDINMSQDLPGVILLGTTGQALNSSSRLDYNEPSNNLNTNLVQIVNDSNRAFVFRDSIDSIETGSAVGGVTTVTQMDTDLSNTVDDDHYNGRILIFTSGNLNKQATDITAYDASLRLLTYSTITQAPQAGDTFLIL